MYCIWGSLKQHSKKTGSDPSSGLRFALGAFRTSPVTSLYGKAQGMSLKNRCKKLFMSYVLKLKTCPDNPAYSCVFEPTNSKLYENSNLTPPLGLRILPLFADSKIDLDTVDDTTVSDAPPKSQFEPQICLSLTRYKKDTTNPEVYKQAFFEITPRHQNHVQIFSDGSKVDEKVAAAAVSSVAPNSPFSCRLRDHRSIYTAELPAILFALKQAYQSQQRKFMIFSDSLPA